MEQIHLYRKINSLPSDIKNQVNDFIDFLLIKRKKQDKKKSPKFGCAKGDIFMAPDFDEPLADFADYM